MGTRTGTVVLLWIFSTLAWSAPKRAGLDQQLASINAQRESLQRQMTSAHVTRWKPIVFSPPARITASLRAISPPARITPIEISAPDPILTPIAALEPVTPLLPAPQYDCPPLTDFEADPLIYAAAGRQMLSPALLRSVIRHESGFRPCAVSPKGAQGLMQLMPATASQFGVADPFDARQNIEGGAAFLRQLLNRYGGDLKLALSAYNAGIRRVEISGGVPNLLETQNYVSGILGDLGMDTDEPSDPEEETAETSLPSDPPQKDFRRVTLQLSLLPQEEIKSSIHLTRGN